MLLLFGFFVGCAPTSEDTPLHERPPPEQLLLLEQALADSPEAALALCPRLTALDAQERCRTLQTRPHLWQRPPQKRPATFASPYRDVAPLVEPCDRLPTPRDCWSRHARGRAMANDPDAAAQACAALDAGAWKEECTFQAAEALIAAYPARYAATVHLCAVSGRFVEDCLDHARDLLSAQAPMSPTTSATDWAPLLDADRQISQTWAAIDRDRGAQEADRMWGSALANTYAEAARVTGAPLDVIPTHRAPHARGAMAWRMMQHSSPSSKTLSEWAADLATAEADRSDTAPTGQPRRALPKAPLVWTDGAPEDAAVISWLGRDRRVSVAEPEVDRVLAVLNAAARHPDGQALVAEARTHPDPRVRWTAARLSRPGG